MLWRGLGLTFSQRHEVIRLLGRWTSSQLIDCNHPEAVHSEGQQTTHLMGCHIIFRSDCWHLVPATVLANPETTGKWRKIYNHVFCQSSATVVDGETSLLIGENSLGGIVISNNNISSVNHNRWYKDSKLPLRGNNWIQLITTFFRPHPYRHSKNIEDVSAKVNSSTCRQMLRKALLMFS